MTAMTIRPSLATSYDAIGQSRDHLCVCCDNWTAQSPPGGTLRLQRHQRLPVDIRGRFDANVITSRPSPKSEHPNKKKGGKIAGQILVVLFVDGPPPPPPLAVLYDEAPFWVKMLILRRPTLSLCV